MMVALGNHEKILIPYVGHLTIFPEVTSKHDIHVIWSKYYRKYHDHT
jgi:hypothetical protein